MSGTIDAANLASMAPIPGTENMQLPDISKVMKPLDPAQLQQLQTSVKASQADLANSRNSSIVGNALNSSGANQVATGQTQINAADIATLVARKQADAEVYARFGTTPGAPSALVAGISERIKDKEASIEQQRDMISSKLHQGFWDNPFQWLANQITLPFDTEAIGNDIKGRDDDIEYLHHLAALTTDGTSIDAAAAYTTDTLKLAGLNNVAYGQANEAISRSTLEVAQIANGTANVGNQLAVTPYNAYVEAHRTDILTTETGFNDYLKIREDARNTEKINTEISIEKLNSRNIADQQAGRLDLDTRVMKLKTVTGIDLKSYDEFRMMADGPVKQMISELMWNPDIQQGMALSTVGPVEATILANNYRLPLTPGQSVTRDMLTREYKAVETALGPVAKTTMTPAQISNALNNGIEKKLTAEYRNIPDSGGFFSPMTLPTVLNLPGIQGTVLAQSLAPLANTQGGKDNLPTRAETVVATAANLIQKGTLTPAQAAAQVANFYTTINQTNDTVRGYRTFALPVNPAKDNTFMHVLPSSSLSPMSGAYEGINLANKAAMEAYFTRLIARQRIEQSTPPPASGTP